MEGDVLSLLKSLQDVADEIDRLESRRSLAKAAREKVADNLRIAEESLQEKEKRAHGIDIERRKRELSVKAERDRMQRVKSRLGEVKTSREYQAVLAETSAAKQVMNEQEEALLRDEEELAAIQQEMEQLRTRIDGIAEDLAAAGKELEQTLGETDAGVGASRAEEDRLLKALPREVVDRYRLIRSRRGGLAVVEARDEACTACYMRLPPQMYIEIIRRSRVVQCPNCHRILIPPAKPQE